MTISLIPGDQPHGDRLENEEAARGAGLTQTVQQQAPTAAPPPGQQAGPPQPLQQAQSRQRGQFDAFESRDPTQSGNLRQDRDARVLDALEVSPSPVLRDLAKRLRGF